MANIYSLQLLRNSQVFTSKEQALTQLTSGTAQDGVIKLARYTQTGTDPYSGDTNGGVKTIFAFRHEVGGQSGWTVYEDYKEVLDVIKSKIDSMSGEGSGSIYGQIMTEIGKLDYSDYASGDSKVVVDVTETDGVVAATGENIANIKLADYTKGDDAGKVAATDTLGEALSKLEKQLEVVSANTADAISGLDYSDSAVEGEYVSQVTETDGVINVTRVELPTVAPISEAGKPIVAVSETKGAVSAATGTINAEFVNVADAGNLFSSTTVEATLAEIVDKYTAADVALKTEILGGATTSGNTLGKLEDRIEALDADAKEYHIVKTTTGLLETIKERYSLVDADGNVSGDTVDIPKDSHIVSITYDGTTQKLTYNYIDASGDTQSTDVDMSELVLETEFGSGVTVTDHVAHGVVDPTSDTFLTVGAGGFKLAGVQDAIDAASGDVKTKLDALSAKTVTEIASSNASIAVATAATTDADGTVKYDLTTDASKVKVSSAYTAGSNAPIITGDTLDVALAKLEKQAAAAKTAVEKDANATHLTVTTRTGLNNETIYTIGENDIASASALTAEIAARKVVDGQTGQTYAANASANYIANATSLNDADVKLDAALKTVADSATSAQTEIDAIETAVGLNADGTHAQSQGNYTSSATTIEGEIIALDGQVKANADAIEDLQDSYISGITMNGTGVTVTDNVAALTATYTNTAAASENGMVITTGDNGGLTFQFGTLDAGTY